MNYPSQLQPIFNTLLEQNIKPIIVGGFVRDSLLEIESKDIDIELYNLASLDSLEKILAEFGDVNSVGKSFGVCKLTLKDLDIDFSLPRRDSKISKGHAGFKITTDSSLDFPTATSRRDFTMNAIGYDVSTHKLLDPFNGIDATKSKLISAVDLSKFDEDPLRVLRAIQFASRFEFHLDDALFEKCKTMLQNSVLEELPKERIFEEIKKLLLKSKKPSIGFKLLQELGGFTYFKELASLSDEAFALTLKRLDYLASLDTKGKRLALMLSLLTQPLQLQERTTFLQRFTNKKELLQEVLLFTTIRVDVNNFSDYDIYLLATQVTIKTFLYYLEALSLGSDQKQVEKIKQRAIELNVLEKKAPALLLGRDLISLGLKPSEKFSTILHDAYLAQINALFHTKDEAIEWVKKNLL